MSSAFTADTCRFVARLKQQSPTLLEDDEDDLEDGQKLMPRDPRKTWAPLVDCLQTGARDRLYATAVGKIEDGKLFVCLVINSSEFSHVGEYEWTAIAAHERHIKRLSAHIYNLRDPINNRVLQLRELFGCSSSLAAILDLPTVYGQQALEKFLADVGETDAEITENDSVCQRL